MSRFIIKIFLFTILIISCDTDDSEDSNNVDLGVIKTSQMAVIEQESVSITEELVLVGNQTITLTKISPKEITFLVPSAMTAGVYEMRIPSQNNLLVNFTVKKTVLSATPDALIAELSQSLNNFSLNERDTNGIETLDAYVQEFEDYYQNLTDAEKIVAAEFYEANKQLISNIINTEDFEFSKGRDTSGLSDDVILKRFGKFTLAAGLLTYAAQVSVATNPILSAVAGGLAVVGYLKAYDYLEALSNRKLVSLDIIFASVDSQFKRGAMPKGILAEEVFIFDDVESTQSFQIGSRAITSADSTRDGLSETFGFIGAIQGTIDTLNVVIQAINNAIFFSNIPLVDNYAVATSNPIVKSDVTSTEFANFTFTLESDKAEIKNISFQDGNANLKVKLKNPDDINGDFLETTLNYTYTNTFNDATGSIPIKINKLGTINPLLQVGLEGQWRINILSQFCQETGIPEDLDGTVLTFSNVNLSPFTQVYEGTVTLQPSLLETNESYKENQFNTGSSFDSYFNLTIITETPVSSNAPIQYYRFLRFTSGDNNNGRTGNTANFDFNTNSIELYSFISRSELDNNSNSSRSRDCGSDSNNLNSKIRLTKL